MNSEAIISILVVPLVGVIYLLLKEKIEKVETSANSKIDSMRTEIVYISQKQSNLLDQFLTKFSNWEDRLKAVVLDITEGRDPTSSYSEFEDVSRRLKDYFAASMEILERDLKKLEKTVRTSKNKKEVKESLEEIKSINYQLERQEQLFSKFHEILSRINIKGRSTEKRVTKNKREIDSLSNRIGLGKISLKQEAVRGQKNRP